MSERSQLEEITIRGLGVIEEASLEFGSGFTVLTGETGAGKTMILTALALVLGGKSDSALVRQGRERLVASGSFRVPPTIAGVAIDKGAEVDEGLLILTRSVSAEGKSKSNVGGVAVPAGVLAELSDYLIEIHAQASSMSITKANKQREILDRFAGAELVSVLERYRETFDAYHQLRFRILLLRSNVAGREKEIANLREFADAFNKVKPQAGELSALAQEISRLGSVEELRRSVGAASELLSSEETGALDVLGLARKSLEAVQDKDPLIAQMTENVAESFFLLADAASAAHSYLADLAADPARLEIAQSRLGDINTLLKRFAQLGKVGTVDALAPEKEEQIAELITKNASVENSIADLTGGEDRLVQMEAELKSLLAELSIKSAELSKIRKDFAKKLSASVSQEIHSLSMPHTQFLCEVISPDYSAPLPASTFTATGADEIAMLLQPHRDGPLVPVAKGASGGELSRVMLALEVVLAHSQPVGTYVFDEVDAGVGGKAAIEVGRRLFELSKDAQVIVVTHLAQVAAWADSHFVVRKSDDGSVTQSDVAKVTGAARIEEIARMLAGHEDSRSAQEHAAELLAMRG
ncbi:MAG: DNA repair protein RecN [Actinomycetota bacterium]